MGWAMTGLGEEEDIPCPYTDQGQSPGATTLFVQMLPSWRRCQSTPSSRTAPLGLSHPLCRQAGCDLCGLTGRPHELDRPGTRPVFFWISAWADRNTSGCKLRVADQQERDLNFPVKPTQNMPGQVLHQESVAKNIVMWEGVYRFLFWLLQLSAWRTRFASPRPLCCRWWWRREITQLPPSSMR